MDTSDDLTLDDLSRVVGFTATQAIAAWFSGRRLWVPVTAQPDHPVAVLIGRKHWEALVREFGDRRCYVPVAPHGDLAVRDRCLAQLMAHGVPNEPLAELLGLTVRRLEQIRTDLEVRGWLRHAEGAFRFRGRGKQTLPAVKFIGA